MAPCNAYQTILQTICLVFVWIHDGFCTCLIFSRFSTVFAPCVVHIRDAFHAASMCMGSMKKDEKLGTCNCFLVWFLGGEKQQLPCNSLSRTCSTFHIVFLLVGADWKSLASFYHVKFISKTFCLFGSCVPGNEYLRSACRIPSVGSQLPSS